MAPRPEDTKDSFGRDLYRTPDHIPTKQTQSGGATTTNGLSGLQTFIKAFNKLAEIVHINAVDKGFYENVPSTAERIALMHSELSEALEADREGNPASEKIPFSKIEEELADEVIRIMDFAAHMGFNIGEAIVDKIYYNSSREYKHGGKKY